MIHQHHAEQRREHRTDQQQEVLVLGQGRQQGDQGADHADGQGQVLDFQAQQNPAGNRCRVNIGEGVFRFIQQDQQQRNPEARACQCQQQGIDFATRRECQGVGHAQAHQPEITDKEADRRTAEDILRTLAETRVVGNQWQP
ncbi:hypothetical protein D9M71_689410 [compost metagenome]